jgi:molybdate-binding protein
VAPGNPKACARQRSRPADVRIVNREPGSGSRKLLDQLMARDGLPAADVAGYTSVVPSHTAVRGPWRRERPMRASASRQCPAPSDWTSCP